MNNLLTPQEVLQAIIDGKKLEYKWCEANEWRPFNRLANGVCIECIFKGDCIFRPFQEMITIGGVSFPKPESETPEQGCNYYSPNLLSYSLYICNSWEDDRFDARRLEQGLVHLTEENAIAHAKALIKLSGGSYE